MKDTSRDRDIVVRLRDDPLPSECYEAADVIEFLRTEITQLKVKLERANSPVWDSRNDYEGPGQAPYHPPECGGFQGHED